MAKNQFPSTSYISKKKKSDIPAHQRSHPQAHWALFTLLEYGYVEMSAFNEIEVQKLMKCLKVLKLKVKIYQNHYPKNTVHADNDMGRYEFMLEHFEDPYLDEKKKETTSVK